MTIPLSDPHNVIRIGGQIRGDLNRDRPRGFLRGPQGTDQNQRERVTFHELDGGLGVGIETGTGGNPADDSALSRHPDCTCHRIVDGDIGAGERGGKGDQGDEKRCEMHAYLKGLRGYLLAPVMRTKSLLKRENTEVRVCDIFAFLISRLQRAVEGPVCVLWGVASLIEAGGKGRVLRIAAW